MLLLESELLDLELEVLDLEPEVDLDLDRCLPEGLGLLYLLTLGAVLSFNFLCFRRFLFFFFFFRWSCNPL